MTDQPIDAFLSYAHEPDKPIAKAVQRTLQTLGKPWYRRRAMRVFRDESDNPAAPDLQGQIASALRQSRSLIVLLSPEAAEPDSWVSWEVDQWIETSAARPPYLLWSGGNLWWDKDTAAFDPRRTNVIPESLHGLFTREPHWVDIRDEAEELRHLAGRNQERAIRALAKDRQFRDKVAAIAAPLLDRPLEDLVGEDIRQHARTRRFVGIAGGALAVLLIALAAMAPNFVEGIRAARQQAIRSALARGYSSLAIPLTSTRDTLERFGDSRREFQTVLDSDNENLDAVAGLILTELRANDMEAAQEIFRRYSDVISQDPILTELLQGKTNPYYLKEIDAQVLTGVLNTPPLRHTSAHVKSIFQLRLALYFKALVPDSNNSAIISAYDHATMAALLSPVPMPHYFLQRAEIGKYLPGPGWITQNIHALKTHWPDDPLIWTHCGDMLKVLCQRSSESEYCNDSEDAYQKAMSLDGQDSEPRHALAIFLSEQRRFDEALAEYERATELDPNSVRLLSNYGLALKEAGQTDDAITTQRKAVALDPTYSRAYRRLGTALDESGEWVEAEAVLIEAVALDSRYHQAWNDLGDARFTRANRDAKLSADERKGLVLAAINAFRKAVDLYPNSVIYLANLGIAALELRELDQAEAAFRQAIRLDSSNAGMHLHLGQTLNQMGRFGEATASVRTAIELDPDESWYHFMLGLSLMDQEFFEDAIASLEQAIQLDPEDPRYRKELRNARTLLAEQQRQTGP